MTLDAKDPKGSAIFPTTGTPTSLAPLVDFSKRGDKNNFGPRVGFAWDVRQDAKTVFRADYGIYYNPMNLQIDVGRAGRTTVSRRPPSPTRRTPDPYGGQRPDQLRVNGAGRTSRSRRTTSRTSSRLPIPAGISQALTSALAIHVDGVYNKMTKIPMAIDINPRSGGTIGNRPLPQFARVLAGAVDRDHELQGAAGPAREAARSQLHVHGVAHAREAPTAPSTTSDRRRRSPTRRISTMTAGRTTATGGTRSVASGSFLLPGSVTVGGVFTRRSTMPFSAVAGIDLNGDAATTDYVPGTTRNVFNRGNDDRDDGVRQRMACDEQPRRRCRPRRSTRTSIYSLDMRAEQGDPAHVGPEGGTDRPGLQPAEPEEPARRMADQRLVACIRRRSRRPPTCGRLRSRSGSRSKSVRVGSWWAGDCPRRPLTTNQLTTEPGHSDETHTDSSHDRIRSSHW